jgi:HSP20 family protein
MSSLMEPLQRDVFRYMPRAGFGFFPPADIIVTDEDVSVYMDVPGLRSEQLEIELEHDVLTVRGERPYPYGDDQEPSRTWRRIERAFGRFERGIRVPRGLDPDTVEAALTDGVLNVRMPKPQPLRPHRIEVRGGEGATSQPSGGEQQGATSQPSGGEQQGAQASQQQGATTSQQQGAGT